MAAICEAMRSGDNPYYGQKSLDDLEARLASLEDPREITAARGLIGRQLLVLGDPEGAIEELTAVLKLAGTQSLEELRTASLWSLALAHLAHAEDQNCLLHHTADSCILPISAEGVHSRPEHSRLAGDYFLRYLEGRPDDIRGAWLLNLARRVSGDFPSGVPERWRLAESSLRSSLSFERWPDRAPDLGLGVVDLAGGAVMDDFDGDGFLDLVTSTWDPCGSLKAFRNEGDGGFRDVTREWQLESQLGGLNLVQADYDGDGRLDLLVLRGAWMLADGAVRNSLLRNVARGDSLYFEDVTREAGLDEPAYPTQAAAWADYDSDGDLDLYVGNEAIERGVYLPDQLFRNEGRGEDGVGRFVDVAAAVGVTSDRYAKAVSWGDYDNDGDADLYVSNFGPNRLYRNDGVGSDGAYSFVDVAEEVGVTQPERESFTTWFFDYDNDGDLDLFVSDYRRQAPAVMATYFGAEVVEGRPLLYRNDGGRFSEVSLAAGLNRPLMPMGGNYGDLDNDGWLDFYLGTGEPELSSVMPNVMYRNVGGRFEDVTFSGGFGHLQKGHGVAFGDLDHDGDQDLFHQLGGFYPGDDYANALFENPGREGNWVTLLLESPTANRFAVGARLEVKIREGGVERSIHRVVGSGGSFGGSSLRQEIGVGYARIVDEVIVGWPTGLEQRFGPLEINRFYEIVEGRERATVVDLPAFRLGGP